MNFNIIHNSLLQEHANILITSKIESPLGQMYAIADTHALYLLEFIDCKGLGREVERLKERTKCEIVEGRTPPLDLIEKELDAYFAGTLQTFKTPIVFLGTLFQQSVWHALQNISFGQTVSYADLAQTIGNSTAYRAVARANAANQLAIIIPCHRVINTNGAFGGYAGGIARKEWLLNQERKII